MIALGVLIGLAWLGALVWLTGVPHRPVRLPDPVSERWLDAYTRDEETTDA